MTKGIAILGWGSLLWESAPEFDRWHDQWRPNGPLLKLEFSRVSSSRQGVLTLVIDTKHGVSTTVAWCLSKRERFEDTVADLRCREGAEIENIHSLILGSQVPLDDSSRAVAVWAAENHVDVVVWTGLPSNFATKVKEPFSVDAAIAYLKSLPPEGKVKAAEYIWRAPEFVRTPISDASRTLVFQPTRGPLASERYLLKRDLFAREQMAFPAQVITAMARKPGKELIDCFETARLNKR